MTTQVSSEQVVRVANLEEIRRLPNGTSSVRGADLDDTAVLALSQVRSLRRLDLSGCESLTDRSITALRSLTDLEELDLTLCLLITDTSVEAVASLPQLRRLSLHGCYNVTDRGLEALARSRSLEKLILWACEKVTDRGVESLAKLSTLRHLELPEFAPITDSGLVALSSSAANLETLRLDHLSGISDEGVRSLVALSHLATLIVQDCRLVTEAAIAALRMALPSCQIAFNR